MIARIARKEFTETVRDGGVRWAAGIVFTLLAVALVTSQLAATIKQSAAILGMNDAFLVSSYTFMGLAALVWLADSTHLPLHATAQEELSEMLAEEMVEEVP